VSGSPWRGGVTQQRVRATIALLGGYWRPLAALARLLEELGELAELLADPGPPAVELAAELADLWIISAALADQFLGEVAEPGSDPARMPAVGEPLAGLVLAAGPIARIVNYYDGPKAPRSVEGWPSLSDAVAGFHRALAAVARVHHVDLGAAVGEKLDAIARRDSGRFQQGWQDPSTAACVARFGSPETGSTRLWGAPAWSQRSVSCGAAPIVAALISFTRAAARERLDAYVIPGPRCRSTDALERWLRRLLRELSERDPRREPLAGSAPAMSLSFNGVALAVMLFSPLYPSGDPRHSASGTFAVLRPLEQPAGA
jgi:hypothetical protein